MAELSDPSTTPESKELVAAPHSKEAEVSATSDGHKINASGHEQELERIFNPIALYGYAVTTGNTWITIGGSIVVAIYNGGPPGVLYEFIVVSVCYWFVAASIAELASAIPSSGGVYHWAAVAAGPYGRVSGWFAGWWNFFAWLFAYVGTAEIVAELTLSMYALFHPDFELQRWHVFVSYLLITIISCSLVLFANRILPMVEAVGGFLVLTGVFITIIVCAVMPAVNGRPYASHRFVWGDWVNSTGYSSNGFVFVAGMLNGAFSVGTPDVVSHLAEEIPKPSANIPKAVLTQFIVGFITAFTYLITILYGIDSLDDVLDSSLAMPLVEIYRQATGSAGGALGLSILILLPACAATVGACITASRILWTLSRENATPFSKTLHRIHPRFKNPFNSILVVGVATIIFGAIYVGSSTAFAAFVDSYVVLSSLSYIAAILPHLLTKRSNVTPGWFWMKGAIGYIVNAFSCGYMIAFVVIFCFPFSLPVTAENMNYTCLITGGLTIFMGAFWFWRQKNYIGPQRVA
ncbi:hypothetical protein A1O1_08976 [Capronia coronata CBS 617.96]|uniref:Choline transporter n=1 Tax=Capronia coronata CBS 617.96 TaxID=1182541 RepID=W9XMM3_9EURO|nr:uncharacterized protein A1O1_08976 [Capronia coronata CBS 617.96]EXJ78575.1 hypothetical protein A1O1_08976 [Capronia coronata CBS 617.96]